MTAYNIKIAQIANAKATNFVLYVLFFTLVCNTGKADVGAAAFISYFYTFI